MGRKKLVQSLHVYLSENLVGTLVKQTTGAIEFQYDENWMSEGYPISLSLPLGEKNFRGDAASFYFDNLLPDNRRILEAIATKFHAESTRQFDLLATIGKDCVGALTFFDSDESPEFQKKMKMKTLDEASIARKIQGLAFDSPLGMEEGEFRISLAGAQEKMALLYWKDQWWEPQGQTPTSHILKKKMGKILGNIDFNSSVDNEWICLRLAAALGIRTCEASIENFDAERVLSVKRFDRAWKDKVLHRIPQEDLCQALGVSPQQKYERDGGPGFRQVMTLLETSNNADEDRRTLLKLALFNDLIHNTDGHIKNVSIYILRSGFALTPMYDLLSAHFLKKNHPDRHAALRSSWSVNGKFAYAEITLADWIAEAKAAGISEKIFYECWNDLIEKAKNIDVESWGLPKDIDREHLGLILEGFGQRITKLSDKT